MQLWPFISHSGFLLESRFSDFFKFAIFSTKISLFLQIHFNLLEDKHSFGYFWTPKSTYDICSVFLYMLSYTLSPKNSKIEILFCQTLRPECNVMSFKIIYWQQQFCTVELIPWLNFMVMLCYDWVCYVYKFDSTEDRTTAIQTKRTLECNLITFLHWSWKQW